MVQLKQPAIDQVVLLFYKIVLWYIVYINDLKY